MERMIFLGLLLLVVACQHEPEAWTDKTQEKEVSVLVRAGNGIGILSEAPEYQLYVYDAEKSETEFYEIAADAGEGHSFSCKLAPGSYIGFCLVNAGDRTLWEYDRTEAPSRIFLQLKKEGEIYLEAGDYLLGRQDFTVKEEEGDPVVFYLQRKVAQLGVQVENIPAGLSDLTLHVSSVPQKMNLLGEYSQETRTITKTLGIPVDGISVTRLLAFPTSEPAGLALSYRIGNTSYTTAQHRIQPLEANRVTEIKAVFASSDAGGSVDFQTEKGAWDGTVIQEEDWFLELPPEVCEGEGNGRNEVVNGGFEEEMTDGVPAGWKLAAEGTDKKVVGVTTPVQEGRKAVRLEGKTYLYQDITVTGGKCYQLRLYAGTESAEVKWRYWGTWMNGSKNLPSDELRTTSYLYQTEGYTDVYQNGIFRAPEEATKLRIEIRTYAAVWTAGVGLYVDAVAVEPVE